MSNNDTWTQALIDLVWSKIPELEASLIINRGNVIEYKTSKKLKNPSSIKWLKSISKKISDRFSIHDFDEELGGLRMTINVFSGNLVITRPIRNNSYLLTLIMPLTDKVWPFMVTISKIEE
jgi:hypothetical protein